MSRKKPSPKRVTVVSSERVSPNMQRILLKGEALAAFPSDCEGSYIKLLFDSAGNTIEEMTEGERPVMRTYTVRRFLAEQASIEVDFVRHVSEEQHCGYATRWADNAKVGDSISIVGPGAIAEIDTTADWFFMVADMTALPALSAKIRTLPADANGYAVIKVASADDIQTLSAPLGVKIYWLVEDEPLLDKVESLTWLDGTPFVWVASEFDAMRALRGYFRNDRGVNKQHIYISSYWKQGVSEDGHKAIKQQDAQNSGY
ncbi:siderophore-interacting protein [Vibrio gallicus]|uniref:siderophore-interacting protein n=1 Tax=Vibrio gallicus TaxID=190897 RepID=UPI0021C278F2|nr:siderophore-interacting protein [Vibrio gallicus]